MADSRAARDCAWPVFLGGLPAQTVNEIENRRYLYARTGVDRGLLPNRYQTSWHSREYVEKEWSRLFDVAAYAPRGTHNRQDLVVPRSR